ncbi:hypothetical protein C2I36_15080 [Rhodobacteraceae bacterium WD3A24]|nr:hypothetical protein C2I36_15080 [Rhodobacteraceae bacterium WD3A24]
MTDRATMIEQITTAFRENGVTAAIGAALTFLFAVAGAVTRKAFTSEALVRRLEQELREERKRAEKARIAERDRLEAQRAEDMKAEQEHRKRVERDIHQMRELLFAAFQHPPPQD